MYGLCRSDWILIFCVVCSLICLTFFANPHNPKFSDDLDFTNAEPLTISTEGEGNDWQSHAYKIKVKKPLEPFKRNYTHGGTKVEKLYTKGHVRKLEHLCSNKQIDLLILIVSAPKHFDLRNAIRETWGCHAPEQPIASAFLVGNVEDAAMDEKIENEMNTNNDIIRGHYLDVYYNLTMKKVNGMEWADTYCKQAKFVVKTDDDAFLNVPLVMEFIKQHENDEECAIFGPLSASWGPHRSEYSKYYLSPNEYTFNTFPDFFTGLAYVIDGACVHDLYVTALDSDFLKLEDVFMTGLVAEADGIKRIDSSIFENSPSYDSHTLRNGIVSMTCGKRFRIQTTRAMRQPQRNSFVNCFDKTISQ